jgi:hypothetical protein
MRPAPARSLWFQHRNSLPLVSQVQSRHRRRRRERRRHSWTPPAPRVGVAVRPETLCGSSPLTMAYQRRGGHASSSANLCPRFAAGVERVWQPRAASEATVQRAQHCRCVATLRITGSGNASDHGQRVSANPGQTARGTTGWQGQAQICSQPSRHSHSIVAGGFEVIS